MDASVVRREMGHLTEESHSKRLIVVAELDLKNCPVGLQIKMSFAEVLHRTNHP